jgi:hypothetical protein
MSYKIQFRRDNTVNWVTKNPILAPGEMGVDVDLLQFKIGDGVTPWTGLAYYSAAGGITNVTVNNPPIQADSDWILRQMSSGVTTQVDSEWVLSQVYSKADNDSDLYAKTKIIHTKHINTGKTTLQDEIDKVGTTQQIEFVLVAGSHSGGANFTQSSNFVVSGPQTASGGPIINFYGAVNISGAATTRARFSNINFFDKVTIVGTTGRHYFKNCVFQGGVEFTGSMGNWVTFEDCSFDGGLTVPVTFAGIQYHIRSAFAGSTLTLSNASPLQLIFGDCTGLTSFNVNATLLGNTGLSSGYSRHDANELYLNGRRVNENLDSDWVLRQVVAGSVDSDQLDAALNTIVSDRLANQIVDSEWVLARIPTYQNDSDWILRQIPSSSQVDSEWVLSQTPSVPADSEWILRQIPANQVDSDWVLNQIIHRDSEIQASAILLTNDSSVGKLSWNYDESTLDVQVNSVNIQVGQEQVFYGKAQGAIAKGDGVMFVGAQGGHVLFAKADATSPGFRDEYIIGVAAESMANNVFGFVVSHGKVRNINTSAWAEGSILWLSPDQAGVLIDSEPNTPNHSIMFASVLRSHSSQGVLMVRPSFGYHLEQLHDVLSTNAVDGDVITWNASTGYWENRATSDVDSDWVLRQIPTPSPVDSEWVLSQTSSLSGTTSGTLHIENPVVEKYKEYGSAGTRYTGTAITQNFTVSGSTMISRVWPNNNIIFNIVGGTTTDANAQKAGEAVTVQLIMHQDSTPRTCTFFYNNIACTVYWQDGLVPEPQANTVSVYTFTALRTSNSNGGGDTVSFVTGSMATFST